MNKLNKETQQIQTTLNGNYECDDGNNTKKEKQCLDSSTHVCSSRRDTENSA